MTKLICQVNDISLAVYAYKKQRPYKLELCETRDCTGNVGVVTTKSKSLHTFRYEYAHHFKISPINQSVFVITSSMSSICTTLQRKEDHQGIF